MKRLFSAAAALAIGIILTPVPALAHDEVVGTTPSIGQTVQAGAVNVSVTFNEDIMSTTGNAGLAIEVTDPTGNVITGCPMAMGAKLSAGYTLNDSGTYKVTWRSVSNDGHPNEGSFDFVVDASGSTATSAGNAAVCDQVMSMSAPSPSASNAPSQDPFLTNLPFLIFGMALVVLGAAAGPLTQKLRAKKEAQRKATKGE